MSGLSFRLRLLAAGSVSILVALGLAAWGLAAIFAAQIERATLADLASRVESLAIATVPGPEGAIDIGKALPDPLYDRPYSGHYWQVEMAGQRRVSRSLWDYVLPLPLLAAGPGEVAGPQGERLLVVDRLIQPADPAQGPPVRVAAAVDRREVDLAVAAFLADLAPYLLLLALVLLAANAAQVFIGLRPFLILGRRLHELESGQLSRIGSADLPAELRPMARRIDQMFAARETERDRARQRAADLAHGLKTPLQALLGEATSLSRNGQAEAASAIEATVQQMRAQIDRELNRTRLATSAETVSDAAEVARAILSVLRRTPQGEARSWTLDGVTSLKVRIDRTDLTEALGALAENAARHAVQAVRIDLSVAGAWARIAVIDDGPGVPEADLARLTDRGVRLDEQPGTSGLGLAIASEIASASGGGLSVHNLPQGFKALLTLPLAG